MANDKWVIEILSDEEFAEYKREEKRKAFLKELEQMSKPAKQPGGSSSFSIKDIKPKEKEEKQPPALPPTEEMLPINVANGDWSSFVSDLESNSTLEYSPIESITDEQMVGFQLDEDLVDTNDKYSRVFKKELAMLSEVLKDVKSHGTTIRKQLDKMASPAKGAGSRSVGITKNYSDLVTAYNGINSTKLQIIKEMAALRSKQVDWKLKAMKEEPDNSQDADTMADLFYRNIINGGTKNFNEMGAQRFQADTSFEYNPIFDDQPSSVMNREELDPSNLDGLAMNMGFNPTQPIQGTRFGGYDSVDGDEFGNIVNEGRDVDICVYEYGDGQYQFVALDENGEVVEGVELPSDVNPDVIESLHIRPGSDYVYDFANRKYRVIQMGPVDVSDIDEMDYPYDDDFDDKR